MKIILSSKRSHYVARAGIFLIVVALIAGIAGCTDIIFEYDLTIASTTGGSVLNPGEDTFNCDAGAVVNLVAEAEEIYQFVNWTGDVGTIADVNDATTTITMNGDYTITANFVSVEVYNLTISSNAGGSVTTPGEGTYTYDEGTVVNLVASPDCGYRFVEWTGGVGTVADVTAASTTITMNGDYTITANFKSTSMVAGGCYHTVGLESDGTVVAVGDNSYGQRDVGGWTGIVQVAAGYDHTVGLESDGTVVAVGDNSYGQCDVGGWTGIVQVAAGYDHTVGLKSDGTVVAVGENFFWQCNVTGWTGIVQVAAGARHTVGLTDDDTVVAEGFNGWGQCNVGGWTDITQVAAGVYHTVGLKDDGTVVAVGWNQFRQCDVGNWTGIVQVFAGAHHTVGLESDGTVVAVGRNDETQCDVGGWTDIILVAAGHKHTVGLKDDGTVVAVGWNYFGECDVGGWDLN